MIDIQIRNLLLTRDFPAFLAKVVETVSPSTEYLPNWHIELICEYLLAVEKGDIKQLLINIAPRHLKSISVSVAYPAWLLGHNPAEQIICASYSQALSQKHSNDCRRVIQSDWYKEIFPKTILSDSQNTQKMFVTTQNGHRYATSIGGTITGLGGNCLPDGTMIDTDIGKIAIEEIIANPSQYKIKSYNHSLDLEEYKSILATKTTYSDDLYEISTIEGFALKCTGGHKIFIANKGYIAVSELRGNEQLFYSEQIIQQNKDHGLFDVCKMFERIFGTFMRNKKEVKQRLYRQLLLQRLFMQTSCSKKFEDMYGLSKESSYSARQEILFNRMQKFIKAFFEEVQISNMCELFAKLCNEISYSGILQSIVCQSRAFPSNAREHDISFESREKDIAQFIPEWNLQKDTESDNRTRQSSMRKLYEFIKVTCTSYRREYTQQLSHQFNNTLYELPFKTSSQQIGNIGSITKISNNEHIVYDLQIEGNNNFFAENILVHNCMIIDDALSADEALSTRKREVACQWFDQTLYSRLNNKKTGRIIVIEQRLHEQDLSGYLLKKGGWEHLSLPIIAERDEELGLGFKKYIRKEGELLHPANMDWPEVNKTKSNNPDSFYGQYQQRPVMPGGAEFKLEWLHFYENLKEIGSFNKYVFVDPASAQKKHSDYTVMMVLGFGKDGNVYMIDMVRDRLNLTAKQKALFALQGKYKPLNIFYQKYGIEADIEYFKEVMERDNYRFTITPVSSKLDKVDRILRLQPYFANGKVYLPKSLYRRDYENNNKDLIHDFIEDEYLKFTKHNRHMHDDMLDTMAMFIAANVQYPNESATNYYKLYDKLNW